MLSSTSLEGLVGLINIQNKNLGGICVESSWYNTKKDIYECIYAYFIKSSNIKQEDYSIKVKVKKILDTPIQHTNFDSNIPCCDDEETHD